MQELLIVAGAHLLAVASPGPDLALVLKNSIGHGRRSGIYSALGIACGIMVHVFYSMVGLALVISRSVLLFNTIKLFGAAYLIWIGFKALKSKKAQTTDLETTQKLNEKHLSNIQSLKQGFLTNVLNPKATLFFLSLFTQVIDPGTPNWVKLAYGLEMTVATFLWFTLVATFMTHKLILNKFLNIRHHVDHVFGTALIALGIKVATGKQ